MALVPCPGWGPRSPSHIEIRQTGMTDGSGSTTWTYNLAGLISTESRTIAAQVKTVSYTYNQDGSRATLTYPSGRTITYTTNNAERTTSAKDVTNNIQYAVTASYSPVGTLNSVIYGPATGFTGVTTTAAYNSLGEPTTISATSSGGTAQNLTYSFALPNGNNGSVSAIQNNANSGLSEAFSHDNLNRIMSAKTTATSGAGCWGQSFGPTGPPAGPADDVYSNLTLIGVTNCTAGSLGIAVSATTNRITTTGYSFDAAGNMTQEAAPNGYDYSYDAENHLTQATGTTSGTWTYVYDGNGMRVEKSNGSGGTLYWRAASGATIAETDLNGVMTSEYTFFAGQRIARRDASNNVYYYYSDQVGSTTAITTASGVPCYEATFTPYGEEHNTANTCPQNYKFTGYERDSETGLEVVIPQMVITSSQTFGVEGDPFFASGTGAEASIASAFTAAKWQLSNANCASFLKGVLRSTGFYPNLNTFLNRFQALTIMPSPPGETSAYPDSVAHVNSDNPGTVFVDRPFASNLAATLLHEVFHTTNYTLSDLELAAAADPNYNRPPSGSTVTQDQSRNASAVASRAFEEHCTPKK